MMSINGHESRQLKSSLCEMYILHTSCLIPAKEQTKSRHHRVCLVSLQYTLSCSITSYREWDWWVRQCNTLHYFFHLFEFQSSRDSSSPDWHVAKKVVYTHCCANTWSVWFAHCNCHCFSIMKDSGVSMLGESVTWANLNSTRYIHHACNGFTSVAKIVQFWLHIFNCMTLAGHVAFSN